MNIFNQEISNYLESSNSELVRFLKNKTKNNYFDFFDDFLFEYGINSISLGVSLNEKEKYVPYINCKTLNIFHEYNGVKELSEKTLNKVEAERTLAAYIISNLNNLSLEDLNNFNTLKEEIERVDSNIKRDYLYLVDNAKLLYMQEREVDGAYYEMQLSNGCILGISTVDFSVCRYKILKVE